MRPQRLTFGRMYANAGYTAKYRRGIRRIIKAMHEDTRREIRILYNDTTYDAPVTLTQIMAKLREKWYKIFTKRALVGGNRQEAHAQGYHETDEGYRYGAYATLV